MLSEEQNYVNDAMESLRCAWGFSEDDVNDKDAELIREKADDIMEEAFEKYEQFLNELGYEQVMGVIVKKGKIAH